MTTDDNKDIVRRFVTEVLAGGQLDRIDGLVGPGYVNRALGTGLEAFKGMLSALAGALPDRRFDIEDLVAEGDAVVVRFTAEMRQAGGKTVNFRGLTFYRLAGGKIVEDDPITTPDLAQELGAVLGSPPA